NVVWMLDDFTESNGALRVVPGSHCFNRLPQDVLGDPLADHPQQCLVTGAAGSVIVMNAHLWHGGMANRTPHPRTAVHAFYCRRDKPQQQYQQQLLDADLQAALPPALRKLLALDDALNDELCRQNVVRSGFLA
ncbi:MAG TPA: phytanoyl-CoA dioxygenase family protein, partial [Pirellulales bacterium]|nr:phytanoyl-CoA dioxygenase family protein [Pirellulales bacterium]